jgi:hypothetical protein
VSLVFGPYARAVDSSRMKAEVVPVSFTTLERYVYVERAYEDVWAWLAGHLSTLGSPLPDGGHLVELRVRPAGREYSRPVRFHVGGLVAGEGRARAALGWADARRPHLFPQLEAVLEVVPVSNGSLPYTQIGVLARYRPPFGALGAIGDRIAGAEVTDASLTTFLDELANAVAGGTTSPSTAPEEDGEQRSTTEDGPSDGLATRPGGAVRVCERLMAVPGVVNVGIDPWVGLVEVDHDPALCISEDLRAAVEEAN